VADKRIIHYKWITESTAMGFNQKMKPQNLTSFAQSVVIYRDFGNLYLVSLPPSKLGVN